MPLCAGKLSPGQSCHLCSAETGGTKDAHESDDGMRQVFRDPDDDTGLADTVTVHSHYVWDKMECTVLCGLE